jgi:peptidoglycan/xylan/chitin deacetylase (PgdA/CDA1 family)
VFFELRSLKLCINDRSVENNGQKYFRCPYGAYNPRVLKAIKDAGYESGHTEWNIDPNDWKPSNRNPDIVSSYVINKVRELCADPKRRDKGAVVLLHDIHPTSVDAAKIIVNELKDSVNFVQIDEINKSNSSFRIYKEPVEGAKHDASKKKTPPPPKGKK